MDARWPAPPPAAPGNQQRLDSAKYTLTLPLAAPHLLRGRRGARSLASLVLELFDQPRQSLHLERSEEAPP